MAVFLAESLALAAPLNVSGKSVKRWARSRTHPVITYYLDDDVAGIAGAIRQAFQVWENVPGAYIAFAESTDPGKADVLVTGGSQKNTEDFEWAFNEDGEVIAAQWLLLDKVIANRSESVLAHEVGHLIGLRHSVNDKAVMSYRRVGGYNLNIDDEFAVTRLYPQDGDQEYPLGCATVAGPSPDGGSPPSAAWLEVALLLAAALLFRSRAPARSELRS